MIRLQPADLQRMHEQLQDAIRGHAEWHRRLVRALVCRLTPDASDLRADAHRHCGFGQWLYHQAQRDLKGRPDYATIEDEHRRLHALAARLLREMSELQAVPVDPFDEFVAGSARLRLQLDSLRHEMSVALRSRDALTGTYRRVEILPALREARELAARGVQFACIAFMDVDHFKAVNDTHGHGVGDEVLAAVAACVTRHLRGYDKVFRYGGDEFLLLLPGTNIEEAWQLVERIRCGLQDAELGRSPAGEPVHLTVSFGITPLVPELAPEESIAHADKALLCAKTSGRNRTVCWDPATGAGTAPERELGVRQSGPGSDAR
jgi:diguanylate cyclase (GGDEF)-like protein